MGGVDATMGYVIACSKLVGMRQSGIVEGYREPEA